MPIRGEKTRKINLLKKGKGVRPPRMWWNKMIRIISHQYRGRSKSDKSQILGGIWQNYSTSAKIDIIKKYQS